MLRRGCTLWLLFFIFISPFLFSSNFHEHLFSLPFPENIAKEHVAIFALPTQKQLLSRLFPTQEVLEQKLGKKCVDAQTLKELCERIPGQPEENLLKILTFTATKHPVLEYEMCETLRKNLLLALPLKAFLRIFEAYFRQEPLCNRKVISATVTRRFFANNQCTKRSALVELAQKYGSKLIYRVSLQRKTLLESGVTFSEEVIDLLRNHAIGGIDVVGSLKEANYIYPCGKKEMQEKLFTLFEFISKHHLIIVLHLFETTSDDPFYRVLKQVLLTWKRPLFIEVGHIATLTKSWIALFAANPSLHLLFHVNPQSNHLLHNIPYAKLQKTVKHLLKKGFPVALGSDGRGILPASSYKEQRELFSFPLSSYSFLSLREVLFTPLHIAEAFSLSEFSRENSLSSCNKRMDEISLVDIVGIGGEVIHGKRGHFSKW